MEVGMVILINILDIFKDLVDTNLQIEMKYWFFPEVVRCTSSATHQILVECLQLCGCCSDRKFQRTL